MLKPLSLSVSLAVALGACGLSFAGGHGKSLPTAQCETPSAQSVVPSGQHIADGCGDACGPVKKKCDLFAKFCWKPKPACYTYEWVLKKKKVHNWSLFGHKNNGCGEESCDSCGVTPSGQNWGSGQGLGSGQSWGTTQVPASYSAPQGGMSGPGNMPGPGGADVEPPKEKLDTPGDKAPEVKDVEKKPTASTGGLQLLPAGH